MNIPLLPKLSFGTYAFVLLGALASSQAAVVYSNDFETPSVLGFDSAATTPLSTTNAGYGVGNQSMFLGKFTNNTVSLTLSGLTAGTVYDIDFDLFIGSSWDGNSTIAGPDRWSLTANASPATLVNTTFIALTSTDGILNNFTQNYSDSTPTGAGAFPAFTGADVVKSTGTFFERYGIFYFGHGAGNPQLSFTAAGSTQILTFQAAGLDDVTDEFWALDNVVVSAVPEPASALFGFGTLLAAFAARRRKA